MERFWTIQPISVVAEIGRSATIRVDPDHPRYGGVRPRQYDWLASALARHRTGFGGGWPWWLTCDEPDLVEMAAKKLPGGVEQASIELVIPNDRCVTFPLWMWETIYTGTYLAADYAGLEDWLEEVGKTSPDDVAPLAEPLQARLEASWERLFDPEWRPPFWYRDRPLRDDGSELSRLMREASTTQVGLTEELRASDIASITEFRSRR